MGWVNPSLALRLLIVITEHFLKTSFLKVLKVALLKCWRFVMGRIITSIPDLVSDTLPR